MSGGTVVSRLAALSAGIVVVAAGVFAGCGGGEDLLSKSEFVEQAEEICGEYRADREERVAAFRKHQNQNQPRAVRNGDVIHFAILPPIESEIWRLERLNLVPEEEEAIRPALSAQQRAVDALAVRKGFSLINAMYPYFAESGELFREYGLPACANDRPSAGGESA